MAARWVGIKRRAIISVPYRRPVENKIQCRLGNFVSNKFQRNTILSASFSRWRTPRDHFLNINFEKLARYERINVIGTSGSGKSTFSRQLAGLLNLPCYEMDRMYWKANWRAASDDELNNELRNVVCQQKWILDGNYTLTLPLKWEQVQLVIWLDMSFLRTVLRVTKRTIGRSLTGQEIWPETGNRESLRTSFFSKDSVIWWAISTYRKNRRTYSDIMDGPDYPHIEFLRLKSPSDVTCCLNGIRETKKK